MTRRSLVLVLTTMLLAVGCADSDQKGTDLMWDLRAKTTVGDLGGAADSAVGVEAPSGGTLDVLIRLPQQLTVEGKYSLVSGFVSPSAADPATAPIESLQLHEPDVATIADLRATATTFDQTWGFTPEARADFDSFMAEMEQAVAAAGNISTAARPTGPFTEAFSGTAVGSVSPALQITIGTGYFSPIIWISWDPAVEYPNSAS